MSEKLPQVPAVLATAVALLGMEMLPGGKECPQAEAEILAFAAGASKSEVYELRDQLREVLPTLLGDPERAVLIAIRDYVMVHADAVSNVAGCRTYSDNFRRFIVGLADPGAPGEGMSTAEFAFACGIPLGTIEDWLRSPTQSPPGRP